MFWNLIDDDTVTVEHVRHRLPGLELWYRDGGDAVERRRPLAPGR